MHFKYIMEGYRQHFKEQEEKVENASRPLTEDQIKHMVNRFLGWRLPKDFHPDAGISYVPLNYADQWGLPTGTNLLSSDQADKMVRYMIDGMPKS